MKFLVIFFNITMSIGGLLLIIGGVFIEKSLFQIAMGMIIFFRRQIFRWLAGADRRADQRQRAKWDSYPELRTQYYRIGCWMTTGLPLAVNTVCMVDFDGDSVDIQGGGMEFSISYSKITNIQVHTETSVQHFLVSRAWVEHRTVSETNYYFVVNYLSENQPEYIVFQFITPTDRNRVEFIVEEQRGKMRTENIRMEL